MSSITNVNNNSSIVTVGRTTPVSPGQQPAEKSIPVVLASDQTPVPVEEQNKVQSEVALSLLGIPRAEVALGIFADVNTYDVNPSEWSSAPEFYISGHGIKHLPNEAGALVEAPRNKTAVLTSKRFFRYQPGRVSAATFGIKSTISAADFSRNPVIRKYGIFDNFDGYYWETRNSGVGDNFSCVRRTQSVSRGPSTPYGIAEATFKRGFTETGQKISVTQTDDYRFCGRGEKEITTSPELFPRDRELLAGARFDLVETSYAKVISDYNFAGTLNIEGGGGTFTGSGGGFVINSFSGDITFAANEITSAYTDFSKYNIQNGDQIDITGSTLNSGSNNVTVTVQSVSSNSIIFTSSPFTAGAESAAITLAIDTPIICEGVPVSNYYFDLARGIYGTTTVSTSAGLSLVRLVEDKCTRDADYWVDFFLLDMEWGGTAHTAFNLTNFTTALIPNYTQFEGAFYSEVNTQLSNVIPDLTSAGVTKIQSLISIITANLDNAANGSPTWSNIITDYGSRNNVDTMYDVKKQFWGYFVSTFSDNGGASSNPYDDAQVSTYVYGPDGDGTEGNPVTNDTDIVYTGSFGRQFTLAEVKYKCQRDVADFVIEGFKNDIVGGGNSETKYNMSMYYKGSGLSVASQDISEKARHTYLKRLIQYDLTAYLGYTSGNSIYDKQTDLSDKVITNFDIEDVATVESGTRGFAGNLVALRDGLIMVHAGVYDPALLKERKKIRVSCAEDNQLKLTSGQVTFGQHVKFAQAGDTIADIGDLIPGTIYKVDSVIGPKGNEFKLKSVVDGSDIEFTTSQFATAEANGGNPANVFFETVVPFMFPAGGVTTGGTTYNGYDPEVYRPLEINGSGYIKETDPFPAGMMFPYMYASSGDLYVKLEQEDPDNTLFVGYINTALQTSDDLELIRMRDQIDNVNFIPEYINWVKNNVKPEFWGVYEYRVPRSRFSFDKLDGISGTTAKHTGRLYSDLATGDTGIVRPGQKYAPGGSWVSADSLYSFDFTKVTMLKIEFSWYGAVGALFLAYVPVDNGEARWVRVHHLRASNQLKIASLGNATLPITYNVYGGGDTLSYGDGEEDLTPAGANYETRSHNIVKYGASYYIDGGDRGTVRLYSHNNDSLVDAYGKQWSMAGATYNATDPSGDYAITITGLTSTIKNDVDPRFFMGAQLKTDNPADQNIRVVFAEGIEGGGTRKIFLSSDPVSNNVNSWLLIVDRANNVYGLETKRVILSTQEGNAVRNRVQVYPTKMSTSNIGGNPVRLRMRKTPIFQTEDVASGVAAGSLSLTLNTLYDVTSSNLPLDVTETGGTYLQNGENVYGWFRALVDSTSAVTVFGRLYKEADFYYFEVQDTFNGLVTLTLGDFLPDLKFTANGAVQSGTTKATEEKEGLSSILISTDPVVPIPRTGVNVATVYLQVGTEQFDLASYFDYNKEYLSFPLTDTTESLYLAVDSDTDSLNAVENISIGITWEEQ